MKHRIPEFPAHWDEGTFGEIFDFLPSASNSRNELSENGDVSYIHYGDIHTRYLSHLNLEKAEVPKIDKKRLKNVSFLRNGDWVMAMTSEDAEGVGTSIEVLGLKDGQLAVAGMGTLLLREKGDVFVPGFKGHIGSSRELRKQYLRVARGTTIFGISKSVLRDLVLPIPSKEEQTEIACILSDMDEEISASEILLAKKRLIKKGVAQELLSGRVSLS